MLLDAADDIEVVGEAADGRAGRRAGRSLAPRRGADGHPHAGHRRPGRDPADRRRPPARRGTKIVILTTFEIDEYVFEALRAGASGFLVKDTEPEELLRAVRVVARGDALLSPSVTRRLDRQHLAHGAEPARPPARAPSWTVLTDRGARGARPGRPGLSNDEIAGRLFVSPLTAKTHVSRAMIKLGARDRAQLVVIAYESGLVVPGVAT